MKKTAVIGNPVSHSLSPIIFNYWFKTLGIEGSYEAIQTEGDDLDVFFWRVRSGEFIGCNVTLPFKKKAFQKVNTLDDAALATGAVNMVSKSEGGTLEGRNTDISGFLANLDQSVPGWNEQASHALVLGSGGAARAVVHGLLSRDKKVVVVGRSRAKLTGFVDFFKKSAIETISWEDKNTALLASQLVVNATPLGMAGFDQVDLDFSGAQKNTIVYDLVYTPVVTGFLKNAAAKGLKTVSGIGMLVHQAVPAFRAWFNAEPPVDEGLYAILEAELKNQGHI